MTQIRPGGAFMGFIILLLVIAVIIYFVLKVGKGGEPGSSYTKTPLDVLKNRYAKGEISKEDFDRMRKDLEE
jgi:putative membrane protein